MDAPILLIVVDPLQRQASKRWLPEHDPSSRGGSVGQARPASAGQIYDLFAEYEKTFSVAQMKPQPQRLKTAHPCLPRHPNCCGSAADLVPQPACDEELRTVTNDDVGVERPTNVVREDVISQREQSLGWVLFQLGQQNDRERSETESRSSNHLSTSGEFQGNVYTSLAESRLYSKMLFREFTHTQNMPSQCRNTSRKAAKSDTRIAALRDTRTRNRSHPSTGPVTRSDDDASLTTPKRPRRTMKES